MIKSLKKLPNDKFLINETVVVHNIDLDDEGISYSVDYDEKTIEESEAMELAETFFREAIDNFIKKEENN